MNSTITASPPVPAYGRATASLLFSFRYPSAHVPSAPTAAVRNAGSKQSVRFHSSFPLAACLLTRHAYRASFCLLLNWSFLECPCSVLCSILFYYSILPFALFRNLLPSRSTVFFSLYLSLTHTHTCTIQCSWHKSTPSCQRPRRLSTKKLSGCFPLLYFA